MLDCPTTDIQPSCALQLCMVVNAGCLSFNAVIYSAALYTVTRENAPCRTIKCSKARQLVNVATSGIHIQQLHALTAVSTATVVNAHML